MVRGTRQQIFVAPLFGLGVAYLDLHRARPLGGLVEQCPARLADVEYSLTGFGEHRCQPTISGELLQRPPITAEHDEVQRGQPRAEDVQDVVARTVRALPARRPAAPRDAPAGLATRC